MILLQNFSLGYALLLIFDIFASSSATGDGNADYVKTEWDLINSSPGSPKHLSNSPKSSLKRKAISEHEISTEWLSFPNGIEHLSEPSAKRQKITHPAGQHEKSKRILIF